MQPGPPSKSTLRFPDHWEGKWQDRDGKVMEISCLGKMQMVTFRPGEFQPPFPLPDIPGSSTQDLAARFFRDQNQQFCLEVTVGEPEVGPFIQLHFLLPEGDKLRPAELNDPATAVLIRPQEFSFEPYLGMGLSWAEPYLLYTRIGESGQAPSQ